MNYDQRWLLHAQIVTKRGLVEHRFDKILEVDPAFEISLNTLLILDMTQMNFQYATVILDLERGLVATPRRTRQLISRFLNRSPLTLICPRIIKQLLPLKHRVLPLSFGRQTFVPLTSASHGESDWVGVQHLIHYMGQERKRELIWRRGLRATVEYKGDFEKLMHLAVLYSELLVALLQEVAQSCGLLLAKNEQLLGFYTCDCLGHQLLREQQVSFRDFSRHFEQLLGDCLYPAKEWPDTTIRSDYLASGFRSYDRLKKFD
ncbi:hypothetical protein ACFQ5M_02825 [Agrilactobacillus yilanensis]|uniref:Competence protein n=1 Tax=Agrilactobacillus yilanensis TaxID=2485997 RepID=A0ABW4J499_9LACO|nr:hypothetical protein [Agrilactobacillus yilanensis]